MNPQALQTLIQMASLQNDRSGGGNSMQGAMPFNRTQPGNPYMGMVGGGQGAPYPPPSGPIYGGPQMGGGGGYGQDPYMTPPQMGGGMEYQDGAGGEPAGGLPPELAMYFGGGGSMGPPMGGMQNTNGGGYMGMMGGGGQGSPYGNDMRPQPIPMPPSMSSPSNYSTSSNMGGGGMNYWTPANMGSARPMEGFAPNPQSTPPSPFGRDPRTGGIHTRPPVLPPYSPPGMKPGYGPPRPRKPIDRSGGGVGREGGGVGGMKPGMVKPGMGGGPRGIQIRPPGGR